MSDRQPCPIHRPMPCSDTCPNSGEAHVQRELNRRLAEAWSQGHRAGRDYQGDGWNGDAHDPEGDNPYREEIR